MDMETCHSSPCRCCVCQGKHCLTDHPGHSCGRSPYVIELSHRDQVTFINALMDSIRVPPPPPNGKVKKGMC